MPRNFSSAFLVAGLLASGTLCAQDIARPVPEPATRVVVVQGTPSPAMQKLMDTADKLQASIHELANRPAGPQRDAAMREAHRALLLTQQAMLDLPPDYRAASPSAGATGYDTSVRNLMAAADALRDSIHAMARQPAGERRNQAIRDANRALLDTEVAMANAYDATAYPARTITLGAGALDCVPVGTMKACPLHPAR